MKITPKEYDEMTKQASPGTKSYKTIPMAFLIGGLICVIGQALTNWYKSMGMDTDTASAVTSVTLVLTAALLTGLEL